MALAGSIRAVTADEAGVTAEVTPALRDFLEDFVDVAATRHVASSFGQLRQVTVDAIEAGALPVEALEARFDEWREHRGAKVGHREAVKVTGAVARRTITQGGKDLVWVTFGQDCPYCSSLEGRRVRGETNFLDAGDGFHPEGAETPLRLKSGLGHPPAHNACDCGVRAG